MRYLKTLLGGGLLVFACIWCYLAGQENRVAQAEIELLRAQAAEAQEQARLHNLDAARREQELHRREERPAWQVAPLQGGSESRAIGLPIDVIRHPHESNRLSPAGLGAEHRESRVIR